MQSQIAKGALQLYYLSFSYCSNNMDMSKDTILASKLPGAHRLH